jgi:hypothetical protein
VALLEFLLLSRPFCPGCQSGPARIPPVWGRGSISPSMRDPKYDCLVLLLACCRPRPPTVGVTPPPPVGRGVGLIHLPRAAPSARTSLILLIRRGCDAPVPRREPPGSGRGPPAEPTRGRPCDLGESPYPGGTTVVPPGYPVSP